MTMLPRPMVRRNDRMRLTVAGNGCVSLKLIG